MTESRLAICALLGTEDEDDHVRAHHVTVDGDPDRMAIIWPRLVQAWCATTLSQRDDTHGAA